MSDPIFLKTYDKSFVILFDAAVMISTLWVKGSNQSIWEEKEKYFKMSAAVTFTQHEKCLLL